MQQINITVLNPWFLGAFLDTAATSVVLTGVSLVGQTGVEAALRVAGGAVYAVDTFGVKIAFNIPRNEALAKLDPEDPLSAEPWNDYLRTWTFWNHVRTMAAISAMGLLIAARYSGTGIRNDQPLVPTANGCVATLRISSRFEQRMRVSRVSQPGLMSY